MALLRVKTQDGWVEGIPAGNQSISYFRGIPYAAPPVGELRWKKPAPVEPWEGVLPCYKFRNIAWQQRIASEGGGIIASEFYCLDHPRSEDCLQLNLWTPAKREDEKLPVAVYFHGGGFSTGYGFLNCYDGEAMAKRGVIVITVSHRLNSFGFLAHPWLSAESPDGVSGNYGLWDLVASLHWVRENVAAFGGDPERVTIFGQSGGGEKVRFLLAAPAARGLFSQAIMQSGGGLQDFKPELRIKEAEARGAAFFDFCGFASLAEARAMPAEELLEKTLAFSRQLQEQNRDPLDIFEPFQPIVDGTLLPDWPRRIFLRGEHPDIPTMVGCTAQEFYRPVAQLPTPEQARAHGAMHFGPERADDYLAASHVADDPVEADRVYGNLLGEMMYASDLGWLANQLRQGFTPAFGYYLTLVPPGAETAHHSAEHHYVFQTLYRSNRPYTGRDYDLSNQLCDYWTNFMKYGDPNGKSGGRSVGVPLPAWTPFTREDPRLMEIRYDPGMMPLPKDDFADFLTGETLKEE